MNETAKKRAVARRKEVRISPRKVQIVLDTIRGKNALFARGILKNTSKSAAEPVLKILNEAIANAENNFQMDKDSLFVAEGYMGENHSDVSGLIGQYVHGNEPCHHEIYMYDFAGRPDRCQKLVRTVMDSLYFDAPDGLCGNEDVGQMSSWYVLSALGLYQVDPSGGDFYLGSPAVREAVVNGNFRIKAHNNSASNIYVKNVKLNGKVLEEPRISYADIMAGGTLEFEMTDKL